MIILVWGVTGTGKSSVGTQLAHQLDWTFLDADDFHPDSNLRKLAAGTALTDADRQPWLLAIRRKLDQLEAANRSAVLACSALKREYRRLLGVDEQSTRSVLLHGSFALIAERLAERQDHFMNPALLQSQLDTLEPESEGLAFDVSLNVNAIVHTIVSTWHLSS